MWSPGQQHWQLSPQSTGSSFKLLWAWPCPAIEANIGHQTKQFMTRSNFDLGPPEMPLPSENKKIQTCGGHKTGIGIVWKKCELGTRQNLQLPLTTQVILEYTSHLISPPSRHPHPLSSFTSTCYISVSLCKASVYGMGCLWLILPWKRGKSPKAYREVPDFFLRLSAPQTAPDGLNKQSVQKTFVPP